MVVPNPEIVADDSVAKLLREEKVPGTDELPKLDDPKVEETCTRLEGEIKDDEDWELVGLEV